MVRAKTGTVIRWHVQDEVNQESEQVDIGGMNEEVESTDSYQKKMVICNETDVYGWARVTTDEEGLRTDQVV